jgi:AdoMet-dependent rRNA methyltransferase SPB1
MRRRHKEKKKDAKKRGKALRRQQLGMNLRSVDLLDTDNTLFNLRDIKRLASKAASAGADVDGLDDIRDVDLDHDVAMSNTMAANTEENDGFEDMHEVELENELDADDLLDDAGDGDLALRFRQHDQAARMEDMEEDFDRAYAQYLSKKNTKEAELKESSAKGEGPSKGLKLTRMQKLKQQAILTEAALAGQLEAEHQKYLKLLAGVRNSVGRSAVAGEANAVTDMPVAQLTGVKRKRDGALAEFDVENVYDEGDDDDDDDAESLEEEDDGIEGHDFSRGISAEVRANRWFSNPIFKEADVDDDMVPTNASKKPTSWSDSEDDTRQNDKDEDKGWLSGMPKSDRDKRKEKLKRQKSQEAKVAKKAAGEDIQVVGGIGADLDDADAEFERVTRRAAGDALSQDSGDDEDDTDEDDDERRNKELIRKGMGRAVKGGPAIEPDSAIEIVRAGEDKAENSDSDDSDTDSDASSHDPRLDQYDSDTHAEMLALGKMLKKHTSAKKLLDASYNRYAFDDTGLPGWFEADESRHFRPTLPVSKSEVEAIKLKFRDIAARPVARVAEARARKRRRVEIKMQKAKKQAENVMESEELQGHSRTKALARIYRGQEQRKPKTTHVVTSSSGNHGNKLGKARRGGGPVRMVDSRLKKDAKAMKRVAKARGKPSSRGRSSSRGRR